VSTWHCYRNWRIIWELQAWIDWQHRIAALQLCSLSIGFILLLAGFNGGWAGIIWAKDT
jgi:hypothetical protein